MIQKKLMGTNKQYVYKIYIQQYLSAIIFTMCPYDLFFSTIFNFFPSAVARQVS